MKKINTDIDFIKNLGDFSNKQIVDVGCGTGILVRWFASQKANVTGIDIEPMLSKALAEDKHSNERYIEGVGENLPFEDNFADYIFYAASFHHIPTDKMDQGIEECKRVLKKKGIAVFIEPVAEKTSYYELVRLLSDETEIQLNALNTFKKAVNTDFALLDEKYYFFERSLDDYSNLLEIFEDNISTRQKCLEEADNLVQAISKQKNIPEEDVRFRSIIRVNLFQKN